MDYSAGLLTLKPRAAKITKNTDSFGKGDPYLLIKVGNNDYKTATQKNTQTPIFTESFTVKIEKTYDFYVKVMDEDVGADDFIAETTVSLQDAITKGKAVEVAKLFNEGKEVGTITFELEFVRSH